MKKHDGQSFIDRYNEDQSHNLDPGYWTGGRLAPILRSRRPNRWGWVLVVTGVFFIGMVIANQSDAAWWQTIWVVSVAGIQIIAGVKLLRRPDKRSSKGAARS